MLVPRRVLVVVAIMACALVGASQPAASPHATTLVDQNAEAFSLQQLRGRTIVMNFIFTHCALSCPLQVRELTGVQRALPEELSSRVQFVSVTMDPERDKPSVLKQFAQKMGARLENWSFVTGPHREIARLHQHFGAQVKRSTGDQFDHRVAVYLLDATGAFAQNYVGDLDPSRLAQEIADVDRLYNPRTK